MSSLNIGEATFQELQLGYELGWNLAKMKVFTEIAPVKEEFNRAKEHSMGIASAFGLDMENLTEPEYITTQLVHLAGVNNAIELGYNCINFFFFPNRSEAERKEITQNISNSAENIAVLTDFNKNILPSIQEFVNETDKDDMHGYIGLR